jgi:uncharacterized protein (DUF433 family)
MSSPTHYSRDVGKHYFVATEIAVGLLMVRPLSGANVSWYDGSRGLGMKMDELLERITVHPKVLAGKPTVRGMRISVEQILTALANGVTILELLRDYPDLEPDDIRACLVFAVRNQPNKPA